MPYFLVVLLSSESRGVINEKGAYYQEQGVKCIIICCRSRLNDHYVGSYSTNIMVVCFILSRVLTPSNAVPWNY